METSDPTRERASESRARAARTKRDRTRAALLGAADPAFAARGWARTRVEDIASAAGVSNATAYNHFPSKHALIGHVYAPLVQTLRTQAYRDIAAGRPVVPALIDHLRALVRIAWRNRGLTAALSAGIADYSIKVGRPADPHDENDPRVLAPIGDVAIELIARGQQVRRAAAVAARRGDRHDDRQPAADPGGRPPARPAGAHRRADADAAVRRPAPGAADRRRPRRRPFRT